MNELTERLRRHLGDYDRALQYCRENAIASLSSDVVMRDLLAAVVVLLEKTEGKP